MTLLTRFLFFALTPFNLGILSMLAIIRCTIYSLASTSSSTTLSFAAVFGSYPSCKKRCNGSKWRIIPIIHALSPSLHLRCLRNSNNLLPCWVWKLASHILYSSRLISLLDGSTLRFAGVMFSFEFKLEKFSVKCTYLIGKIYLLFEDLLHEVDGTKRWLIAGQVIVLAHHKIVHWFLRIKLFLQILQVIFFRLFHHFTI